jgi:very-short-patch-repair endonuclease
MSGRRTTLEAFFTAKQLRHSQTPAEIKLWAALKAHQLEGIQFRRQHPIGEFIVDFCAPSRKLIIEIDGSAHLNQQEYDTERTIFLESKGYRVLRFWNNDVMNNIDWVIEMILGSLNMPG